MQCTEYSKNWLNLTFVALNLTFIRGPKAFPSVSCRWSYPAVKVNLTEFVLGWAGVCGKGEIRATLKTPAWEATILYAKLQTRERDKRGRKPEKKIVPIPYCNVMSWFAIALAEIRTGRISRENSDSKQSSNIEDVARKADSSWRSAHVIGIFTALFE